MGQSMALAGYTVTVAPGGEECIQARGSAARVVSATADFRIAVDDDAAVPFAAGLAFTMPQGGEFRSLRVLNPSAAPLTVSLLVSAGEVHDARAVFAGVMSVAVQSAPAVTIAAGQAVNIGNSPTVNVGTMPAVSLAGTPKVSLEYVRGKAFAAGTDAVVGTANVLLFAATTYYTYRLCIVQNIGMQAVRLFDDGGAAAGVGLYLEPGQTAEIESWYTVWARAVAGSTTLTRNQIIF
jgi:hypothetical protein